MLVWVLIFCILIFLFGDTHSHERITILGYSPKYFYVSNGESDKMYEKMKKNGIMDGSIK